MEERQLGNQKIDRRKSVDVGGGHDGRAVVIIVVIAVIAVAVIRRQVLLDLIDALCASQATQSLDLLGVGAFQGLDDALVADDVLVAN